MHLVNYKTKAWGLAILVVIVLVFYVMEFGHLGNTLFATGLIKKSLVFALVIGIYLGWRLQSQGSEQVDKIRIWAACILLSLFFAPMVGSISNRVLSFGKITNKSFEFMEEKAFASSAYGFLKDETIEADGCYLFVFYEGAIHRLKRKQCIYWDRKRGDVINLPVKKGLWGYEIVMQN
ncbi:MAG: hypothetical protein R2825_19960 [Saprospiraceae bacterium]